MRTLLYTVKTYSVWQWSTGKVTVHDLNDKEVAAFSNTEDAFSYCQKL